MEEKQQMSALRRRANELRTADANIAKMKVEDERKELTEALENKMTQFKEAFADVLPLLDEEGITYTAHRNNDRYEYKGYYILFQKGNHTLAMDFNNNSSYRFEHVWQEGKVGNMVFGKWDMDRFILWINEQLIEKYEEKPDPTPAQLVNQIAANYEPFFLSVGNRKIAASRKNAYPPTISFHNLLWSILVGQVYKDKLVCLAPNLSGEFGKSVSIVVVEANDAGFEPVNVLFDPKYSFSEAWDVLDEINEQLWEVSSPQLSRYIVTTSMAAAEKQPTQEEFEAEPDETTNAQRSAAWMEKWRDLIYSTIEISKHSSKLMLDDGEKDDVAVYLFGHVDLEVIEPHKFVSYVDSAVDWVVALRDLSQEERSRRRAAERLTDEGDMEARLREAELSHLDSKKHDEYGNN